MSDWRDSDSPTQESVVFSGRPPAVRPTPRFSTESFAELRVVCEVDGFYVVGRIAKSATGETYLAFRQVETEQQWFALKILSVLVEHQPELLAKVDQEISRSEALMHERIVSVTANLSVGGLRAVALPWVRGASLSAVVRAARERGVLRWQLAHFVVRQACSTLQHALDAKDAAVGVHGAVIPQNIVVDREGRVHILNLGLDVLRAGAQDLSAVYPFRAPEVRKSTQSSPAADVFGLGATLLELIAPGTAEKLLEAPAEVAAIVGQACHPAGCPASFTNVIVRAVSQEPSHRFVSLASFGAALDRVPLDAEDQVLRGELVDTLRDMGAVGFDQPPVLETEGLRIVELCEGSRVGDETAPQELAAEQELAVEQELAAEAFRPGEVFEERVRVARRRATLAAIVAAVLVAIVAWLALSKISPTKVEPDARSRAPQSLSAQSPSAQASSAQASSRPLAAASMQPVAAQSTKVVGAGSDEIAKNADAGTDAAPEDVADASLDAHVDAHAAESPAANVERATPLSRPAPRRRKRPTRLLSDPGF